MPVFPNEFQKTAEKPLVSVVMSVYNGERYLSECITSILSQTLKNFEFLIIDDGSTDSTAKIIKTFAEDDSRICFIKNPGNLGLAKSLNLGVAKAEGEYIARIDCDDICLPERLEVQVDYLNGNPDIAVVGSWLTMIDENGKETKTIKVELKSYTDFLFNFLICKNYLYHPSVMFRKEIIQSLGGYDQEEFPAEDFGLWMRLAKAGYDARIIQKPLTCYRSHSQQICTMRKHKQRCNVHAIHRKLLSTYIDVSWLYIIQDFVLNKDVFWRSATFSSNRLLVKNIKKMLSSVYAKTDSDKCNYKHLRLSMAQFIFSRSFDRIKNSKRSATFSLFFNSVILSPKLIFKKDSIKSVAIYMGVAPILKRLRDWRRRLRDWKRNDKKKRRVFMASLNKEKASKDVSAVIFTVDPNHLFSKALDSIYAQNLKPCKVEIVKNVSPAAKASQVGLDKIKTPFYISVDGDMVLYPECVEQLYCMINTTDNCAEAVLQLQDPIMGTIWGVHMFRTEAVKKIGFYPFAGSKAHDRYMTERLQEKGYSVCFERREAGTHHPDYLPHEVFWKFKFAGELAIYFSQDRKSNMLKRYLNNLCKYWLDTKNEHALYALAGFFHGLNSEGTDIARPLTYEGRDNYPEFEKIKEIIAKMDLD